MRLAQQGTQMTLDLKVELHEGTLGTTLGRCDRFNLNWIEGPWDTEPDVIAWQHQDLHLICARNVHGRWLGIVGLTGSNSEDAMHWGEAEHLGDIAKLTGIESTRLSRTLMQFGQVGLLEYAKQRDINSRVLLIQADERALAPSTMPDAHLRHADHPGPPYVTAKEAVAQISLVTKALMLDYRLAEGTDLAWAFDKALQVRNEVLGVEGGPAPGEAPIRRIDVEEIIAHERSDRLPRPYAVNDRPDAFAYTAIKLWSGKFAIHAYAKAGNVLVETEDPVAFLELSHSKSESAGTAYAREEFTARVRNWMALRHVLPQPLEQIDDEMAREMAALDAVLK